MRKNLFNKQQIGLSLIGCLFLANNSPSQLFSKKKDANSSGKLQTKTFLWGNGIYQPRPDAILQFRNFEPKLISTFQGPNNPNMKDIVFGENNEAGIDVEGRIYTWAKQTVEGNFANPETDNIRENVLLLDKKNSNYIQAGFTKGFLWALNSKGEVHSWAIQKDFDDRNRIIAARILPESQRVIKSLPKDIKQIATGEDHFLGLTKDGDVFSMGDDTYGQCGLGNMTRSTSPPYYERRVKNPRKIEGVGAKVQKIACGSNHSLAITEDGALYGWGSNSKLQLSQEELFSRTEEPVMTIYQPLQFTKGLDLSVVVDVAAGEEHTIIVTENKRNQETEVFACGHNNKGELGAGFMKHISDIAKVEGLSNFQIKNQKGERENVRINQIKCGQHHCIALLSAGVVTEWGENDCGQLGNKKRAFSEHPIMISTFKKQKIVNIGAGFTSTAVICEEIPTPANANK